MRSLELKRGVTRRDLFPNGKQMNWENEIGWSRCRAQVSENIIDLMRHTLSLAPNPSLIRAPWINQISPFPEILWQSPHVRPASMSQQTVQCFAAAGVELHRWCVHLQMAKWRLYHTIPYCRPGNRGVGLLPGTNARTHARKEGKRYGWRRRLLWLVGWLVWLVGYMYSRTLYLSFFAGYLGYKRPRMKRERRKEGKKEGRKETPPPVE